MDLKKFAREINSTFSEPFLPAGFVKARVVGENGDILNLRIGDREVDLDESGKMIGAGTNVGSGVQWDISKKV